LKRANHLTRLAKLRSYLKAQNLDAVLINFLPHVRYLCGYSGSSGLLFVTEKKAYFFTDFRYIEQAQKEVRGAKVIVDERNIWKNLVNIKEATCPRAKIGFQSVFFSHQTHLAVRHMLPQALWIGVENMV